MSATPAPGKLFCFGLGYVGRRLAESLLAQGWRVAGTTRSLEKARAMKALGIEAHIFDRGHHLADPQRMLAGTTHLLTTISPDEQGDVVIDQCHERLADLAADERLVWAGLISTTAVYGDTQGAWVDEDAPLKPSGERGRRRVRQEEAWRGLALRADFPLHIFRLPGIYGPGRSALDEVKAGRARRIDKPGQVFSRIHVEDIVGALTHSMKKPDAEGAVYNIADDRPESASEVTACAFRLLGKTPPAPIPFEEAAKGMSPMALSFYADCRRVSNTKMKEELGYTLKYPDYEAGLKAILAQAPS